MSTRDNYTPDRAHGAQIAQIPSSSQQEGSQEDATWTLILVRKLRHAPEKVWQALTDPVHLREWAPFDADGNLATASRVQLTTVGAPSDQTSEAKVTQADAPKLLEYNWGDQKLRWELEALEGGTRLTLWHSIDRNYIAMGAAGWHICLDVLDHLLAETPLGRIVGAEAMKFDWPRLHREYRQEFGLADPQAVN